MVIVASIALSTMLCNDLIMPVLLRVRWLRLNERPDLSGLLLAIRRGSILGIAAARAICTSSWSANPMRWSPWAWCRSAPPRSSRRRSCSASTGRAPPCAARCSGLSAGFLVWLYTLLLPALARSGWLDPTFLTDGLFGIDLLRPYALFGLGGLDPDQPCAAVEPDRQHRLPGGRSLVGRQGSFERIQASLFVEVDRLGGGPHLWRGSAAVGDLRALLARYVGAERAEQALAGPRPHAWPVARRRRPGRFRPGQLRRAPARRRDRRGIRPGHDLDRGQGRRFQPRRGPGDSRRGLPGDRVQPRAGAEVQGARGRHSRS